MLIKILGVVGSKRRQGNTSILVQTLLNEAEKRGAHTEQIFLADYDYADCNGCEGCRENFQCVVDDGMQAIYPKILEAGGYRITDAVKSLNAFHKGEFLNDVRELEKARKAGTRLVKTLTLRDDVIEKLK